MRMWSNSSRVLTIAVSSRERSAHGSLRVRVRTTFVQVNNSFSKRKGTLRGLHFPYFNDVLAALSCTKYLLMIKIWPISVKNLNGS